MPQADPFLVSPPTAVLCGIAGLAGAAGAMVVHPIDLARAVMAVETRADMARPTKYAVSELYGMVRAKGVLRPGERMRSDRTQYITPGLVRLRRPAGPAISNRVEHLPRSHSNSCMLKMLWGLGSRRGLRCGTKLRRMGWQAFRSSFSSFIDANIIFHLVYSCAVRTFSRHFKTQVAGLYRGAVPAMIGGFGFTAMNYMLMDTLSVRHSVFHSALSRRGALPFCGPCRLNNRATQAPAGAEGERRQRQCYTDLRDVARSVLFPGFPVHPLPAGHGEAVDAGPSETNPEPRAPAAPHVGHFAGQPAGGQGLEVRAPPDPG